MAVSDWSSKLNADPEPVVRRMPVARAGVKKGGTMLLPSARIVDDAIRAIPKGESLTLLELRRKLAQQHKVDGCCPVYLGYRLRTVAEAACEARGRGAKIGDITPVWRLLDERTPTLKKLSATDAAWIRERRTRENL